MVISPDDADIESKTPELNNLKSMIRAIDKKISIYDRGVTRLFLISKPILNTDGSQAVDKDGIPKFDYLPPKNHADEPMDEDYRNKMKADLITNIDEFVTIAKEKLTPIVDLVNQ